MGLRGNPLDTLISVWSMTYFSDNPSSFPQKARILTFSKCHLVSEQISFFAAIITSKTNEAENMASELGPDFLRKHIAVIGIDVGMFAALS